MVDTRAIPESVRVSALKTQALAFGSWFHQHGIRCNGTDAENRLLVWGRAFTVAEMRAALMTGGTTALLRLIGSTR